MPPSKDAEPLLTSPVTAADLRTIGLFGALSEEVLAQLAKSLPLITATKGEVIFREGQPGRELFVVLSGEMEVHKRSFRGDEVRLTVLGPGEWFGELSILDVQPRSASVRALSPSRLLVVRAQDLDSLYRHDLKSYAIVILNLARENSRRLRVADGMLADVMASVSEGYVNARRTR